MFWMARSRQTGPDSHEVEFHWLEATLGSAIEHVADRHRILDVSSDRLAGGLARAGFELRHEPEFFEGSGLWVARRRT